mgnify:CR=1 FL=1
MVSSLGTVYLYHKNSNVQAEVINLQLQIEKAGQWQRALLLEQSTLTGHKKVDAFVLAHSFKMPKGDSV